MRNAARSAVPPSRESRAMWITRLEVALESYSFHSNASMTGVVINRAQRVPPPTPSRVEARI